MTGARSYAVAERYARALLDVAIDKNVDPDRVAAELAAVAELMESQPKLADVVATPAIPEDKRIAVLDEVLSRQNLAPITMNFLHVLTTRERMPLIDLVVKQYRSVLLEHKRVQPGDVTSAHPLSEQQQQHLAGHLGRALGKTMELNYRTDPELVGGLVVRVGNRVYDASVVTQLKRFKERALATL